MNVRTGMRYRPVGVGRRVVGIGLALLLSTVPLVVQAGTAHAEDPLLPPPGVCGTSESNPVASPPNQKRAAMCLVNAVRKKAGVGSLQASTCETGHPLTVCINPGPSQPRVGRMYGAAYQKALDVYRCPQPNGAPGWVHTACGRPMDYWINKFGYATGCSSWAWGENIYTGFGRPSNTVRAAVNWWLNSPGHRANLLKREWTDQGIAFVRGSFLGHPDAVIWVSLFGRCG